MVLAYWSIYIGSWVLAFWLPGKLIFLVHVATIICFFIHAKLKVLGECLGNEPEVPRSEAKPTRRRPIDPSGWLISMADVEKLKLKQDDEACGLIAEVPLNRPLYGSDTLKVIVIIDDEEAAPKRSVIKESAQGVLNFLERALPDIESRIKAEVTTPGAGDTEAGLANLHSPSLMFTAEEIENPLRWSFVVEGDPVAVHVEFERLTIVDVWSGD